MEQTQLNQKAVQIILERMSELSSLIAKMESGSGSSRACLIKIAQLKDILATNEYFYSLLTNNEANHVH